MVDDSMKNTGLLFFLMRTTTLIGAMFVLFAICTPTVAGADVEAVKSVYKSKCEEKWPHSKPGALAGCFINCNEQNQDNSTVKIHTLTLSNGSPCIIDGGVSDISSAGPHTFKLAAF
ncbi:hypothetical protein IscW_ISCW004518 [Ixodes scapularis]|uniref:Uncharacterized protein n=1 Tax=Ixodes scapularis TaxID=6945 RepID=B7PE29_IXOSC|nr:hypothetical protein IscW_ISCW004518 [Ixodes scapularis]|eukprot:XP_002399845.1 hypothetical protein IscW_ISCW004518 [Ixodes scapularis]